MMYQPVTQGESSFFSETQSTERRVTRDLFDCTLVYQVDIAPDVAEVLEETALRW